MAIQGLLARVEKLEAASSQSDLIPRHLVLWFESNGQTREQAISAYEAESGKKIAPEDEIRVVRFVASPSRPEADKPQTTPQRIEDRPAEPAKPKGNRMLPSGGPSLDILKH